MAARSSTESFGSARIAGPPGARCTRTNVAVHTTTKAVTTDLKTQFLTVLGLDIPDDVAGDNDWGTIVRPGDRVVTTGAELINQIR